jgi:peptide/nickel transport system substrate-binding protein
MQHRSFHALALLIVMLMANACATVAPAPAQPAAPAQAADSGGTLQVCYAQKTSYANLAGFKQYAGSEHFYLGRTIFNGLVQLNQDVTGFDPELAESWEFDGNKVIFHLRKDVKWHDGTPFTAKDVVFTYGRLIPHPLMTNTGYDSLKDYIVGYPEFHDKTADTVTGITAPDEYTVVFEMTKDYGEVALYQIAGWMNVVMPEHILGQVPEEQWAPDENGVSGLEKTDFATKKAIGTGPFIVEEYVPDQYVIYSPNKEYFRGAPKLDKLIYRSFGNDQAPMVVAIEAGQCDWATSVPPAEAKRLSENASLNMEVAAPPANVTVAYWYNQSRAHIQDPRIRQAFQHAIDGERLMQVMANGLTFPARAYLDGKWGINPKGNEYVKYDPELAKKLLQEAGWDPNDKLILALDSMSSTWEPMHLLMQENLAEVGVTVEFKVAGADYDNVINKEPFEWDLQQAGDWVPWFGLIGYESYFSPTPYYDFAKYQDVVDTVKGTFLVTDDAQLKDTVWQLQERLGADPYALLLYGHTNISLRSKKTQGCDVMPSYYYQRNNWSLEKCWMAP